MINENETKQAIINIRTRTTKLERERDYWSDILRMERNYRSTPQIIEKVQAFISQNKGRFKKNMTAERCDGEAVRLEYVHSREEQYRKLLDVAQMAATETAFLYRDNEIAVVLVVLLLRKGIPFRLRKP